MNKAKAIYKVVIRNLEVKNYSQLLPEAQEAMLREAKKLIDSPAVSNWQKQRLSNLLGRIEYFVS
ncbi:hypothetical protein J0895_01735 [Phormidium pseudopriestleyi FRX01]|uniref:Uncharacterized protein n=1 Tax=Phormidium pseudopriestleyi FRX01 TaxID=1759528 RepID=A0ABS3FLC9_9CYAN|nr:hypothetical protein [Phormidium pseudopriestleyi]MBO0347848.1 hypothetical protein [Phormidium pseudopriestleyi FRX01]